MCLKTRRSHELTDIKGNLQIGKNYAVIIALLKHSQRKLFNNIEKYKKYIFASESIFDRSGELQKEFDTPPDEIKKTYEKVLDAFGKIDFPYSVITINDDSYPALLKRVSMPPPILYVKGDVNLFTENAISIVGSRTPSDLGIRRATKLAYLLVDAGFTVVSGLAKGIDSAAHNGAIEVGGKTIGVIGTPLNIFYPKENSLLQQKIAESHLLVSQFPFSQHVSPLNFPTRNYTMCGLTKATIIVEASERSGALIQARFCLKEGRHLFILKNLLERSDLTWPKHYVKQGAKVLEKIEDVLGHLDDVRKSENKTELINQQLELFETPTDDD